ncbi:MAG: T9SS type A sorting domain-containing protein [Bacteroidota bacterium]
MNIINLLRRLPVALPLLLAVCSLPAQTTEFFVEDVIATVDEEVRVNVRGVHMDEAVGIQFSVNWDMQTLEFLGVANVILDGALDENFNRSELDSGRIGYLEFDSGVNPLGLVDSALLFTLRFQPVTTVSTETMIRLDSTPVPAVVAGTMGERMDPNLLAGRVKLEGSSSLPAFAEDPRLTVAPNPFSDFTRVNVRLNYAGDAYVELLDLSGRTLQRRPWRLLAGTNNLTFRATDFPAAGAYLVRLTTDREQLHRKLLLQAGGR